MPAGGFKTFVAGEILTAADTNSFLMQGVLVFADATARDAAVTSPVEGQFVFRTDEDVLEFFDGTDFVVLESGVGAAVVSGTTGAPTIDSGVVIGGESYDVFTFNGDGSITFSAAGLVDCLVVGGGSGGGFINFFQPGGGGGAGGVGNFANVFVTAAAQTVKVGAGGAGVSVDSLGVRGGESFVGNYNIGAGGQGGNRVGGVGATGGGGWGPGDTNPATAPNFGGISATSVYGKDGGRGFASTTENARAGGGGGGAGVVGDDATSSKGGNGGNGLSISITGTAVTYGGGGGGGANGGTIGSGGTGGGAAGSLNGSVPGAGTTNLGGGGGGGSRGAGSGAGGSGRVIVRVKV